MIKREYGLEVRLTPDADLWFSAAEAEELARYAVAYRERGVVGFGVSGADFRDSPAPFVRASQIARDGGLAFTPHAGEFGGADLVRFAVEQLQPTFSGDRKASGCRKPWAVRPILRIGRSRPSMWTGQQDPACGLRPAQCGGGGRVPPAGGGGTSGLGAGGGGFGGGGAASPG